MVTDNKQWHEWWAWRPVFVPDPQQYGIGCWVWMRQIYRRWCTEGLEQLGYWQYCLDDFHLIHLQALEQQSINRAGTVFSSGLVGLGTCSPQQLLNITTSSNRPSSSSLTFNSAIIAKNILCQQKNPPAKNQGPV